MTGLIESTLYLSVTAIVILLFKRIFKNKLSAKWHVLVWALLALRLVLPSLPESSFSIFNVVDIPENKVEIKNEIHADVELPKAQTERLIYGEPKNDTPQPLENTAFSETEKVTLIKPTIEPVVIQEQTPIVTSDNRQPKAKIKINIDDTVKFIYRVGAVILFVYFVCVYAVCVTRVRKNGKPADSQTASLLEECKKKTGVSRRVFAVEYGNNPMLMGLVKPTVVLPDGYTEDEKRDIIIHELCHLKGGDIYLIWLSMIVLCLNWFNPVMWLCFFVFRRDIEVYCDERVLKYVDSKKNYASLLVKTALKKNSFIAGTTSLKNSEKEVERRVKYMAYFKKPNVWWTLLLIVIAVVIGVVCLTNPVGDEKKEGDHQAEDFHDKDETPDYIEVIDVDDFYSVGKVCKRIVDENENENTTIYYPQIIHLVDGVGESNANRILRWIAFENYDIAGGEPSPNHSNQTWNVDYTIEHSSEKLLSVVFHDEMTFKNNIDYQQKRALNVALPAGYSYDIYEIFVEDFCQKIKHETFRHEDGSELSAEDILAFEQRFKSEFSEMSYDLYYSYYFSDGKLHIILDNNVVICADIESVDYLIKDMSHPIWQEVDKSIPKILEYYPNFYLEEKSPNEYYCEVYDNDGKTIFTNTVEKYPLFRHLDGPLYELRTSYGTFAWKSVFFNVETGDISEAIDKPFYIENGVIARIVHPTIATHADPEEINLIGLYDLYSKEYFHTTRAVDISSTWLIEYFDETHIKLTTYDENGESIEKVLTVPSLEEKISLYEQVKDKNFYLEEKSPNEYYCEVRSNGGQTLIYSETYIEKPTFTHIKDSWYELKGQGNLFFYTDYINTATGKKIETLLTEGFYLTGDVIAFVNRPGTYTDDGMARTGWLTYICLFDFVNIKPLTQIDAEFLSDSLSYDYSIDYIDDTHISVTYYTENGQKENKKILKVPSLTGVVAKEEPKPEQLISTTTEKTENTPVTTSQEPPKTQDDPEELPTEHVAPPLPSPPEELSLGMDETFFGDIENTKEDELDVAAETLW